MVAGRLSLKARIDMESMMKKLLAAILLGLAIAGSAQAAPPTAAQIERLLDVMDAQKVVDQMIPAMMQQSRSLVEQQLAGSKATDADRSRVQRLLASQEATMRDMLAWDKLKPIYISVYTSTMTADEILAMTRFYESPEGRSVMQKMPQVIQRTMQEMQPIAESAMQKMMSDLDAELSNEGKPRDKGK